MRVTKTIREYIEKEVKARVEPKFEAEKVEAKRQEAALNDFLEGASKAAEAAWTSYFEEHFDEIAGFFTEATNGIAPGEGGDVHKDAGGAGHGIHACSFFRTI